MSNSTGNRPSETMLAISVAKITLPVSWVKNNGRSPARSRIKVSRRSRGSQTAMAKAPINFSANAAPSSRYIPGITATSVACFTGRPRSASHLRNSLWLSISPLQTAITPLVSSAIGWRPSSPPRMASRVAPNTAVSDACCPTSSGPRCDNACNIALTRSRTDSGCRAPEMLTMPQIPHIPEVYGAGKKTPMNDGVNV